MSYIILAILMFCAGWYARVLVARWQLRKMLEVNYQNVVWITIDDYEDMYYAYRTQDKSFLAQAANLFELDKILTESYPGVKFAITEQNSDKLKIDRKVIKSLDEPF